MFYLKLFGTPTLTNGGVAVSGRATQRHRVALLALLALAPGRRLSRDKLIAYLWPDRDTDGARNLLKAATYVLRGVLGEHALLSEGDDLRLNTELTDVDVAEFDAALGQRDYACAVSLYSGPFMDGFFLNDAPEFEQWTGRERERLLDGYRTALEALAQAAEAQRDFHKAVEWWKLRAAHDPYDSRIALRLMQVLDASGHRAAALQHASVHERLLKAEFNIGLPAAITSEVERLRREPVAATSMSAVANDTHATPAAVSAVPHTRRRRSRWPAYAALFAAVSFTGAFFGWPRDPDPERSIVVLPFVNLSPELDVEYFSDGLTEEVIARLAAIPDLKVISRTSAMRYKHSKLSLPEIARELNVGHVLEGSVRHDHGRVRITAQLVRARGDDHLWAENYELQLDDSFRAQEEIAHQVARELEIELNEPTRRVLARRGTTDRQAYELYQRGRMFWNLRTREGHELAIQHYQRALERDSNYAAAYVAIADAYQTGWSLNLSSLAETETFSRVKWAAERALAIDDQSADAHTTLASALLWERDWHGADREFRRAIGLNPSHATARTWYTLLLRAMNRKEEAKRQSLRAAELDPFSAVATSNNGWLCYHDHDYDCALAYFKKSLAINPSWYNGYRGVAFAYVNQSRHAEAIATMRKVVQMAPHRPDLLADLGYVQARAGQQDTARQTLARAKLQPLEPFNIARVHIALGEADSAFVWLERSRWHWPYRAILSDPALDPLRKDPRFLRLATRVQREMGLK